MTWLDWMLLILLAALTVRGILRGTIAQVFAFLGFLLGAWTLVVVGHWIGEHWGGARPAVVFVTLRWLVAALAGLAVAAVFQWWGDLAAKAAHDGPLGWVDRLVGGAIGAAFGLAVVAFALLLLLQAPMISVTGGVATRGLVPRPIVHGAVFVSRSLPAGMPLGPWLHRQFLHAARRLDRGQAPARVAIGI